jgi:exonuclease SbcC
MKIIELRWKNLNSLYGEWIIDFTHPEFVANGIFALTGPTGAGKSTILDAICLALYGTTPRLGRITKSSNEIMSRQSGECYAEVLFESRKGRFRCHWEQRRARKKSTGALQDQEHQIADGDTGKIIESKKSLVPAIIEEKTGMDFDRFTRSMLLAQGGFDTFLVADTEQKSRILEQITGTQMYTEISKHVHERSRAEHVKLDLLKAESSGITLLTPEQQLDIENNLQERLDALKTLTNSYGELNTALNWLTAQETVKQDIKNLELERSELMRELDAFTHDREILERARMADPLEGSYAMLTALRKQHQDDTSALAGEQEAMPEYVKQAESAQHKLLEAEKQVRLTRRALIDAAPVLKQVNSLDQSMSEIGKSLAEHHKTASQLKDHITELHHKITEQRELKDALVAEQADLEKYLSEHKDDEHIISSFDSITEQLERLHDLRKFIIGAKSALVLAEEHLIKKDDDYQRCTKSSRDQKAEVEKVEGLLNERKAALENLLQDRNLREYRNEKEGLLREMALYTRIAELEEHRARLVDGKPCPLCGSTEHPYAEGNTPVPDKIEQKVADLSSLIQSAEELEVQIQYSEQSFTAAREKYTETIALQEKALYARQSAETEVNHAQNSLAEQTSTEQDAHSRLIFKLRETGLEIEEITDSTQLLQSLSERLHTWSDTSSKLLSVNQKLSESSHEIKRLESLLEVQSGRQNKLHNQIENLTSQYDQLESRRIQLFGDKKSEQEQTRLQAAADLAETAEKTSREQYYQCKERVTSAQNAITARIDQMETRAAKLNIQEAQFYSELHLAGFTDQAQFLASRLDADKRSELEQRAKELDDRRTDLRAREKDGNRRLEELKQRMVTDKSIDEIKPMAAAAEQDINQLRDIIAGLRHRLEEQHKAEERLQEKQSAMKAQVVECDRWDRLHTLIGSSDGKKYRNFAQGLTFDLMVSHANRELEKMSDRYLLIRDENLPLELNVLDNYQAGEIRSTRNLSGGESFIVSLALALGLSSMSSRRVRVDSLFLDEGFGSLDEQSLETALETLAGLHQDGKLIGIISHVGALKERITTQITVNPAAGGRSLVQGPGCQKV